MSQDNNIFDLLKKHQPVAGDVTDRIIYLGDVQDAIPRLLVFDTDLSATDVRIWMCLRTYVNMDHQSNPCPSYETIMDKLGIGSRETVANALLTLRGTRWLSIIGPRRDHNNRVVKNLYALHSEPLAPDDVLALDEQYMHVLDRLQQHPSHRLRDLGKRLDQAMTEALVNSADTAPLSTIKDRLETADTIHRPTPQNTPGSMFGRPLAKKNESVQLVVDNDVSVETEKTDPSTKIVLGSDNPENSENPINMLHDEVNTPSKYENRTTLSSSSRFINTTTELESENDGLEKWGSAPPKTESSENTEDSPASLIDSVTIVGGLTHTHLSGLHPDLVETRHFESSNGNHICFFDDQVRFTPNEKNLLQRLVLKLPVEHRQMLIDELVGQIIEKRDTPARIRNHISFARHLVNQQVSGFEIWSSACERMAKKRAAKIPDEQRKAQQVAEAQQREAAKRAHHEKLKKWEAELAAKKAEPTPSDNQRTKTKP